MLHPDPSILTFNSHVPGPTLVIMATVHGDEVCGVIALRQLIEDLESGKLRIERGVLHLVFANLPAYALGKRQTQMNLNRAFRPDHLMSEAERYSYEYHRARQLMPLLASCDAMLDIHSSVTEGSTPFIICEPHSFDIARCLPLGIRSHGWDDIEAGGTDYYVNTQGGMGICIECGYHEDPNAPEVARYSIMAFLTLMEAISPTQEYPVTEGQRELYAYDICHTRVDYDPAQAWPDFGKVPAGTIIGTDGGEDIVADEDFVIIFSRKRTEPGKEAFILAREKEE